MVSQDQASWLPQRETLGTNQLAEIDERIASLKRLRDYPGKAKQLERLGAERDHVAFRYLGKR